MSGDRVEYVYVAIGFLADVEFDEGETECCPHMCIGIGSIPRGVPRTVNTKKVVKDLSK